MEDQQWWENTHLAQLVEERDAALSVLDSVMTKVESLDRDLSTIQKVLGRGTTTSVIETRARLADIVATIRGKQQ